jgi:hypothetical protein
MEKGIFIANYSTENLKEDISKSVKELIKEVLIENTKQVQNEYLTRQEVAQMFKVDLSTIHNWCKSGKLKPLGIGARVYFLRADIENSLTPLSA